MNNQIRALLKQAEARYPKHLAVAVPEVVLRQDALEKFAELIVRECVDVIMEGDRTRRDYFADKVKKHFGVEE